MGDLWRNLRVRLCPFLLASGLVLSAIDVARAEDSAYRPPEYGYSYGEVEGPRTMAMGGAARAWGWSTSAVPSNPANLTAQHIYHFEGLFDIDTKAHRYQFGGAVVDSVTSRLAMGVMATKTDLGNDGDAFHRSAIDVRFAAGFPVSDKISLGATGHYLRATQDGHGPLGASSVSRSAGDDPNSRQISFDAGLVFALTESLRFGAVGYNLTSTQSPLMPLMLGGGLGLKLGDGTIEANVVGVDKTTWGAWKVRFQLGGEILLADHYPVRLGYSYDQGSQRHAISGGSGYVDKSFAVDASLRQEVAGPSDPFGRALVFSVGLRYFYESAAAPETGSSF